MRKPVVLVGLGNALLTDEGVGPRVVHEVETRGRIPPGAEAIDLGTAGFEVLHAIAGRRRAVFVDCTYMGEAPGTLRRFTPEEVATRKVQIRQSLHEGDLLHSIELSRQMGECPEEIVILGVEPAKIECGEHLSGDLEARLDEYVEAAVHELRAALARPEPHDAREN